MPMGAPISGAAARLGKGGGAAPALPKHGADGLEAWGKARNSHRSAPTKGHHPSAPTKGHHTTHTTKGHRALGHPPQPPTKGHHPSDSSTPHSDASTHHVSPLRHAGDKAGRNRTSDELGELGGVPCNSTLRGDSAVKLCTKECKPSKVQGQCKTCHCSSCSWCKK
uniref:Uncharacterized protein n=1 Tax=Phaeocystis antarctica TaxID=33657 RepID=A0A7S0I5D7_9EUKA